MAKTHIKGMLERYSSGNPVRLHMPGHKGAMNSLDVTEINATDNLNSPESYILYAQQALSQSYGCDNSFFMVNGSTGAIHAMIKYAVLRRTHPILISRNSHRSILSACMLFNIDYIMIDDKFDDELQAFIFDEENIIETIMENDLAAVIITPVDYFGRVASIENISKACKQKGALLLCDEAHGAHFHITDMLPKSALSYADICVQSPHKTLSALTQCSYIHANNVNIDKLKSIIYSLQTSSPNFLLVQSMDDARYDAQTMKEQWEHRVKSVEILAGLINEIVGMWVLDANWAKQGGYCGKDITRLVIDVSDVGSGIEIGKILEDRYNIYMEMCSFKYIVGIMTPWDNKEWDGRLHIALVEIVKMNMKPYRIPDYPQIYKKAISHKDAIEAEWEKLKLEDAEGKIAAEPTGVYPPGVPLLVPGEVISKETIDYILEVEKLGGSVFGVAEGYINCII